jgi:hypothetical protein
MLFVSIDKRQRRKSISQLLHHFSELGSKNNLTFSSQELLPDCIIGVDGVHRKLLILEKRDGGYTDFVIDLNEVKSCHIKKYYDPIPIGALKAKMEEQCLNKVVLLFDNINHNSLPLVVKFYDQAQTSIYQLAELEQKAKDWEVMLTKMLHAPLTKVQA